MPPISEQTVAVVKLAPQVITVQHSNLLWAFSKLLLVTLPAHLHVEMLRRLVTNVCDSKVNIRDEGFPTVASSTNALSDLHSMLDEGPKSV